MPCSVRSLELGAWGSSLVLVTRSSLCLSLSHLESSRSASSSYASVVTAYELLGASLWQCLSSVAIVHFQSSVPAILFSPITLGVCACWSCLTQPPNMR